MNLSKLNRTYSNYPNLFELIQNYLNISEPIRTNPKFSNPIWTYPILYNLSEQIQNYLNLSESIWIYLNLSEPIWPYLNLSKHIWIVCKPIWTYMSLSDSIWTYPNLSELYANLKKVCTLIALLAGHHHGRATASWSVSVLRLFSAKISCTNIHMIYMEFLLERAAKLRLMLMSLVHDDGLQPGQRILKRCAL